MKILVLNCGSSSIKYKLFDMDHKEVIAQGGIEKIGLKGSFLKLTLPNGEKKILEKDIPEHTVGVEFILNTLTMAWSTGPPGAICTMKKLIVIIAHNVGITSNRRRIR